MATQTLTSEALASLLASIGVNSQTPSFAASFPLHNPVDIYKAFIADTITKFIECDKNTAYDSVQGTNSLEKGDLVLIVPKLRLKGRKNDETGRELAAKILIDRLLNPPTLSGIHLQFTFAKHALPSLLLPYIGALKNNFGTYSSVGYNRETQTKKKVLVDFSSPNIAKEFHPGHLRSTIIGAFLANLHETMGWDVIRLNYLGDWGKQFGLLAVGWERFGSEAELTRDPLRHLLYVYQTINRLFKPEDEARKKARNEGKDTSEFEARGILKERNNRFKLLEDGDPEARALWQRFRNISIQRYEDLYARLNISFDVYSGESQVLPENIVRAEQMLRDSGVLEEEDGASMVDFEKHGAPKLGRTYVRNRAGTTTYLLRDLAGILGRIDTYGFDKMIYVAGTDHDMYFQRLFKTVELMGLPDVAAKLQHISFGRVNNMSSRTNAVVLSDILDTVGEANHAKMLENTDKYTHVENPTQVADTIGITAVMVQDMSAKRVNNYDFNLARMTSFDGDTGPYLQYCHARLCSLLRKAGIGAEELKQAEETHIEHLITEDEAGTHVQNLLRLMALYPDATRTAYRTLEPSTILTYLFRLARQLSSGYDAVRVVNAPGGRAVMAVRALVYERARQILANGMRLLGFTPIERM